jgi:hypothetical protein
VVVPPLEGATQLLVQVGKSLVAADGDPSAQLWKLGRARPRRCRRPLAEPDANRTNPSRCCDWQA